jgi:hypothetical protein
MWVVLAVLFTANTVGVVRADGSFGGAHDVSSSSLVARSESNGELPMKVATVHGLKPLSDVPEKMTATALTAYTFSFGVGGSVALEGTSMSQSVPPMKIPTAETRSSSFNTRTATMTPAAELRRDVNSSLPFGGGSPSGPFTEPPVSQSTVTVISMAPNTELLEGVTLDLLTTVTPLADPTIPNTDTIDFQAPLSPRSSSPTY